MSRKQTRPTNNIIALVQEAESPFKNERCTSQSRQITRRSSSRACQNIKPQKIPSKAARLSKVKDLGPHQKLSQNLQIETVANLNSFTQIFDRLLEKIQLLNYYQPYSQLKQKFKNVVKNHVDFNGIFPRGLNLIGKELLKNGIFHEMWGKVCKKGHKDHQFTSYYQQYYSQLISYHPNFQTTFNQCSSSNDITQPPIYVIEDDDSTTRVTERPFNRPHLSQQHEGTEIQHKAIEQQEEMIFSGRHRLIGSVISNERRLKAEIICYFLGVKRHFHLDELQIRTILEFYHQNEKQLLIMEAYVPVFNKSLQKMVISNQPKVLIAMYGYVSLAQLLRVKQQYTSIEGFILYDQLRDITQWLKVNFQK